MLSTTCLSPIWGGKVISLVRTSLVINSNDPLTCSTMTGSPRSEILTVLACVTSDFGNVHCTLGRSFWTASIFSNKFLRKTCHFARGSSKTVVTAVCSDSNFSTFLTTSGTVKASPTTTTSSPITLIARKCSFVWVSMKLRHSRLSPVQMRCFSGVRNIFCSTIRFFTYLIATATIGRFRLTNVNWPPPLTFSTTWITSELMSSVASASVSFPVPLLLVSSLWAVVESGKTSSWASWSFSLTRVSRLSSDFFTPVTTSWLTLADSSTIFTEGLIASISRRWNLRRYLTCFGRSLNVLFISTSVSVTSLISCRAALTDFLLPATLIVEESTRGT